MQQVMEVFKLFCKKWVYHVIQWLLHQINPGQNIVLDYLCSKDWAVHFCPFIQGKMLIQSWTIKWWIEIVIYSRKCYKLEGNTVPQECSELERRKIQTYKTQSLNLKTELSVLMFSFSLNLTIQIYIHWQLSSLL